MGWLVLLLLLCVALGVVRWLGVTGGAWTAMAAALVLGGAGYALQGRPDLPGSPAMQDEERDYVPLTKARHAFFGSLTSAESWIRISEALARVGNTKDSVGILQNAVKRYPADPQLWIALGNALVDHARGITPPAEIAYNQAEQAAPGNPATPFFYGLALARSGQREQAVAIWRKLLSDAPADAEWRPLVEQGVGVMSHSAMRQPAVR